MPDGEAQALRELGDAVANTRPSGPMFCRRCGTSLRDAPGDRCAQCGRAFDANSPETFSRTRKRPGFAVFIRWFLSLTIVPVLVVGVIGVIRQDWNMATVLFLLVFLVPLAVLCSNFHVKIWRHGKDRVISRMEVPRKRWWFR